MTRTALIVGCSYANGHGFSEGKDLSELWVNELCKQIGVSKIDNCAKSGSNNHWIFLQAANMIRQKNYDVVIVAWSETGRLNIQFGLETYTTLSKLDDANDINLVNHQQVTKKYQRQIGDQLRRYSNYHWPILDLIKYVNILLALKPKNLFFVNSLGVWSNGFFEQKPITLPSDLSSFEQELLEADLRSDQEIFELYNMIHAQYHEYGGIQPQHWLNLYRSLHNLQIDMAPAMDGHPGLLSQKIFVDTLSQNIKLT